MRKRTTNKIVESDNDKYPEYITILFRHEQNCNLRFPYKVAYKGTWLFNTMHRSYESALHSAMNTEKHRSYESVMEEKLFRAIRNE